MNEHRILLFCFIMKFYSDWDSSNKDVKRIFWKIEIEMVGCKCNWSYIKKFVVDDIYI